MIEDLYSPNSDTIGSIAAALSKAQATITHATKSSTNPQTRSRYADLTGIIDVARQPLAENELAVIQSPYALPDGVTVLVTSVVHSSGEWVRSVTPVNPRKMVKGGEMIVADDMQTIGAAITYARRYALAAMLGIGQEDDDGNSASGRARTQRPAAASESPPWPESPEPSEEARSEAPSAPSGDLITPAQLKKLAILLKEHGVDGVQARAFFGWLLERDIGSSKELTKGEASRVIGWTSDQWEEALRDYAVHAAGGPPEEES